MALNTVLSFAAVDFAYTSTSVLEDVSLEIAASEGVALLGPNGVGKTTLTRLAMAMLHPSHGTVETVGRPTAQRAPEDLADRVGYAFQTPGVGPDCGCRGPSLRPARRAPPPGCSCVRISG